MQLFFFFINHTLYFLQICLICRMFEHLKIYKTYFGEKNVNGSADRVLLDLSIHPPRTPPLN